MSFGRLVVWSFRKPPPVAPDLIRGLAPWCGHGDRLCRLVVWSFRRFEKPPVVPAGEPGPRTVTLARHGTKASGRADVPACEVPDIACGDSGTTTRNRRISIACATAIPGRCEVVSRNDKTTKRQNDQPANQATNQPTNQPTNQRTNEPTNQRTNPPGLKHHPCAPIPVDNSNISRGVNPLCVWIN